MRCQREADAKGATHQGCIPSSCASHSSVRLTLSVCIIPYQP